MTDFSLGRLLVLVVEDNPADVLFFEEAVEANRMPAKLHVVGNGADALRFLRRQGSHAAAPRPDVVVLDLNVPVKSGRDVLKEMASDPELQTIPVAILTTSTSEVWVCDLYPSGRCAYFVKTDSFKGLQDIVRRIEAHARAA